jgi:hypothetical protein
MKPTSRTTMKDKSHMEVSLPVVRPDSEKNA